MPPEAPNQKRKRGRPSIASKNKESASERVSGAPTANHVEESQSQPQSVQRNTTEAMDDRTAPKKRGRPRKSTDALPEDNAPPAKETEVSQSEAREKNGEGSNPKRRGRPAKTQSTATEVEETTADSRPQKRPRQATEARNDENEPPAKVRKTGKASAAVTTKKPPSAPVEAESGGAPEPTVRRSTRDRRSADSNPYWSRDAEKDSPETNRGERAEGRSSLREVSVAEAQNQPGPEVTEQERQKKRGRGRPSLDSNNEASSSSKRAGKGKGKEAIQEDTESTGTEKTKDKRRKSDEAPPQPTKTSAKEKASKKATGTNKSAKESAREPATAPERQRRSGPRNSTGDDDADKQTTQEEISNEPQPRSKPRPKPASEVPKYRHLAPKTRQIPRSVIAAKWTSLDDGSISAVDNIISDACRTVLHGLRDREHRRQQAEMALNAFSRRLHSKLVKGMPFPPPSKATAGSSSAATANSGSHEAELDFDRIMGAIKSVEETLDPLLHSVALLTREKQKEEAALEAEYKQLKRLKSNFRDENKKWIEHAKREHTLVPEGKLDGGAGGSFDERDLLGQVRCVTVDGLEIVKRPAAEEREKSGSVFMDIPSDDEELTALSQRIGAHMNSMRSNLAQIDGVLPAITRSKASLQGVLHRYLDPKLYEEVLFGKEKTN